MLVIPCIYMPSSCLLYYPGNIYNVIVNCEDGEYYEYEVEADTFAKATEIAENMALDLMADITYIEVYKA